MSIKTQESIDEVWKKYRKSLTALAEALDENESLKNELNIDFTIPEDIKKLEKKIEEKLAKNGPK
jgi:hypothetical protein